MTSIANAAIFSEMVSSREREKTKNIFRAQHDRENPYTLITNKLLRDTTIKHSDRGLMCQLLSWSDFHNLCIQAVVKKSLEGRDAIRGMIDRLIQAGYIRMVQKKNGNGQFDTTTYQIFEQSTGQIVADLDLSGIVENSDAECSAQLNLFDEFEEVRAVENADNFESVTLSADGFSVNGKHDTNNNYDSRNTENNSNKGKSLIEILEGETKKTKADLLKAWFLEIKDPMLQANIQRAGLGTYLTTQDQLERHLIDFNQQHEKYKHLSHTQRLKNFTVYLLKVKNTRAEYVKHVLRLNALGIQMPMPTYPTKPKKTKASERIQLQQTGCNPFPYQQQEPVEVSADFQASIEGF